MMIIIKIIIIINNNYNTIVYSSHSQSMTECLTDCNLIYKYMFYVPNIEINKIIIIRRSSFSSVTSCLVTTFLSLSILMGTCIWFYLTRFRVMRIGLYYVLVCEIVDDATRVIRSLGLGLRKRH